MQTRELKGKLSEELLSKYEVELELFEQALAQKKGDKNIILSVKLFFFIGEIMFK